MRKNKAGLLKGRSIKSAFAGALLHPSSSPSTQRKKFSSCAGGAIEIDIRASLMHVMALLSIRILA